MFCKRLGGRIWLSAVMMLMLGARVWAHASLLSATPAESQVLEQSPTQLVLHFNEPVTPIQFTVVDRNGEQVGDPGEIQYNGSDLLLPLNEPLNDGVYVVSYRVVSVDTHPTGGAFGFFVGERSTMVSSAVATTDSSFWTDAVGVNRWGLYTFMLLAVGSALFILCMRVPADIARAASGAGSLSAVMAVLCYLLSIGLGGAQMIGGSPGVLFTSRAWSLGASTTLGPSALIGVPAMLLLWSALRFRKRGWQIAGVMLGVLSFLVTGHAATAKPVALMAAMVGTHLVCAAFWLGSLYPLLRVTRLAAVQDAGVIMARFSRFAVLSVLALFASGLIISWVQLRSLSALITTDYGVDLMIKLALFVALLLLAAYNKRILTPRLLLGEPAGAARMRTSIRCEYVLYVLILGAAAALTLNQPPRAIAASTVPVVPAGPIVATAEAQGYRVRVEVMPEAAGERMAMITVMDGEGKAVQLESMKISLAHAAAGIAGIEKNGERAGDSWHFTITEMAIAGEWTVTVSAFVTAFDQVDFDLTVPIR